VVDGSVVDLVVELATDVTVEEINRCRQGSSQTDRLKDVLYYSDGPIVSSDIIGNPYSSSTTLSLPVSLVSALSRC
jgi:glyceraldehyde 3-phosphate dehydrogenase